MALLIEITDVFDSTARIEQDKIPAGYYVFV